MADVARGLGVSKMTVSRVINGQPGVSEETRARVRSAIESLGFIRSQRGRSLAVGRSNLVGMIVLNVTSDWVWQLVLGAGQAVETMGFQLLLRTTGPGEVASFDPHGPVFGSDLIDGAVIVSWRVPVTFARELTRRSVPVVLIDAYERPEGFPWVSAQDRAGARAAAGHLAGLGHRRIAFIGGGTAAYLAAQRLEGFQEGLSAAGCARSDVTIVHGDFSRESGFGLARRLLGRRPPPTAVFAASDEMAVGTLDAALELGMSVPRDLSIVGFDDLPIAMHVNPALTTVRRPYREMGAAAMRIMAEMLNAGRGRREIGQVDLPVELVVRASTAPPGPERR
jgi:LacI family transcriptional regulator